MLLRLSRTVTSISTKATTTTTPSTTMLLLLVLASWSRLLDGFSDPADSPPGGLLGVPCGWGGKGSSGMFCLAKAVHFNGGDAGVDHRCAPGSDSMVGLSAISD